MVAVLTATFEPTESRVRLALTGAAGSTLATFYRRRGATTLYDIVRGGFEVAVSGGETPAVFDYEFPAGADPTVAAEYRVIASPGHDETETVDVSIEGEAWLKFPGFPYLNQQLTVTGRSGIARSTRGDLVQVVNTRAPVAVQEFMSGRSCSLTARTETWEEYVELDAALGLGGVLFLHADEAELGLPSMYATASGVESEPGGRAHTSRRYTTINLAEVSAPGYGYAGTLGTWQTILTTYATWQDVLDEPTFTTWSALLELEGSPADVIVG